MSSQNTQGGLHKELTPSDKSLISQAPTLATQDIDVLSTTAALPKGKVTALAVLMGVCASIGGFMFGYEAGQIGGFLAMPDFIERFGKDGNFDSIRAGTIVGILSIGTLIGCLFSGWVCDKLGRRLTISASGFVYIIGVAIEISSNRSWAQFAVGRLVTGLGIGGLSTSVPMYQSESVPKTIRGVVVCSFQLMITLGIWAACIANFATVKDYTNSASWRIPNSLSAVWAIVLAVGILFLPESPRFSYRNNKKVQARDVMARLNGVAADSPLIDAEIAEIEEQLQIEALHGQAHWYEVFTGPRMLYRTLLGMALQAGQQLTGVNFFFYFGTTIFRSTGISNSYITAIILASVNVVATVAGMFLVEKVGRRKILIGGALWMAVCFLVYTFVGSFALSAAKPSSTQIPGAILIVFTCLFICAFAVSWGPLVWVVVSEMYPPQHRAPAMALAIAANWIFNFIISFTTTFIVAKIRYYYGLVFAISCLCLAAITFFFVCETKGRSLEEVDQMYEQKVSPRKSAAWKPAAVVPTPEVVDNRRTTV